MAKNNKIDLSAYDGQIIDENEYFDKAREDAWRYSNERDSSFPKPTDWDKQHPGKSWWDCLATSSSNYKNGKRVDYNPALRDNPEMYGYRMLTPEEATKRGDIWSAYYIDEDGKTQDPYHAYIINEVDENGNVKSINYSDGSGVYHKGTKNHWADTDRYIYGSDWDGATNQTRDLIGKRRNYRYRYIGTPEERAAIEAHNAAIRAQNAPPPRIQVPVQQVAAPAPVSAEQVLSNGRETLRRLAAKRQVANNL